MGFERPGKAIKSMAIARLGAQEALKNAPLFPKLQRVLALFNALPYTAVATMSAVVGSGMLYRYFQIIEYTPNNLPSVIAFAGLAAAWCFFYVVIMTIILFGTVVTMYAYDVKHLPLRLVFLAQLWPALLAAPLVLGGGWTWVGAITGVLFAVATLRMQYKWSRDVPDGSLFLAIAAPLLGAGLVYCAVEVIFLVAAGAGFTESLIWSQIGVRAMVLIALFALNAVFTLRKLGPIFVVVASVLITIFAVGALTRSGSVVATMAQQLGLSLPARTELRVPATTCRLLLTGLDLAGSDAGKATRCLEGVNLLSARVDLRFGDRWLISLDSLNGRCLAEPIRRLTIPDAGTEIVLPELGLRQSDVKCGDNE